MDVALGNFVQSRELLGGAVGRKVERGVSSSDCVAIDHRHWYRHKLGRIVEGMLSAGIWKFELDTVRRVVEVGGGSGWWWMVEVGGGSGWRRVLDVGGGRGWWRMVEVNLFKRPPR